MAVMPNLVLHPDCRPGPINAVIADIQAIPSGCRVVFRALGDLAAVKIPAQSQPAREDDLWKTTCFEIFWQADGTQSYREFNLSPSGKWASYKFDSFREGMRNAPVDGISIACSSASSNGDGELVLEASILTDLPVPALVALNAIIEDMDGKRTLWALRFPDGKADFHSEVCRAMKMEGR